MPLRIPLDISGKDKTQPAPDFLLEYQFQSKQHEPCPECFGLGKVKCRACRGEGKLWSNHIPFWRLIGLNYFRCIACIRDPGLVRCIRCRGTGHPPAAREPIQDVVSRAVQRMFIARERRFAQTMEEEAERYAQERKRVREEFKARLRTMAEEHIRNKGAPAFKFVRTGPALDELDSLREEFRLEREAAEASGAPILPDESIRGPLGRIISALVESPKSAEPGAPAQTAGTAATPGAAPPHPGGAHPPRPATAGPSSQPPAGQGRPGSAAARPPAAPGVTRVPPSGRPVTPAAGVQPARAPGAPPRPAPPSVPPPRPAPAAGPPRPAGQPAAQGPIRATTAPARLPITAAPSPVRATTPPAPRPPAPPVQAPRATTPPAPRPAPVASAPRPVQAPAAPPQQRPAPQPGTPRPAPVAVRTGQPAPAGAPGQGRR